MTEREWIGQPSVGGDVDEAAKRPLSALSCVPGMYSKDTTSTEWC